MNFLFLNPLTYFSSRNNIITKNALQQASAAVSNGRALRGSPCFYAKKREKPSIES